MKNFFLFFIFVTLSIDGLKAQTQVSGSVTDPSGQVLPFVTVAVKGTKMGVTTNEKGLYLLNVPAGSDELLFSFVGYTSASELINGRTELNVVLTPEAINLDDVIVIAYGTVNKKSNTGGVSVISNKVLEKLPTGNLSKILSGAASGVQASSPSGQPGEDAEIRIRGVGSINASSKPLYVLDGVPYDGTLSALNSADIESISVLKDAASSALFGSRGANGVVMISTKQGRKNTAAEINLKLSQGFSNRAIKDYDKVSTDQYFELYWEALRNSNTPQYATDNLVSILKINPYGDAFPKPVDLNGKLLPGATALWNDNWAEYMERTASRSEANLSVSGGSLNSRYFISGGYLNDKGAFIESGYERYNARINVNSDVKKWLGVGLNMSAAHSKQNFPKSEDTNTANVVNYARMKTNFYPVYQRNTDGSYVLDENGAQIFDFGKYRPSGAGENSNLYASMPNDKSERLRDEASIRTFIDIKPIKNLSFKTSLNTDLINRNDHTYVNPIMGPAAETGGSSSKSFYRTFSYTFNNILTYDFRLNEVHHFNALAGHEYYDYNYKYAYGERSKMIVPSMDEPAVGSQLDDFDGYSHNYKVEGYLGRIEYDYKGKYFASSSLRRDGSSRFHPDARWGSFWSIGASWLLSEEQFVKQIQSINLLKIKASYGAQGNDDLGTSNYYAYQNFYKMTNINGQGGLKTERLGNRALKWESNLNLNLGVEFSLFSNRVGGSFEYFERASKDLLFQRTLPSSLGYSEVAENIGAMKNKGIEIQLNLIPVKTKDFVWNLNLHITHYQNKITALPQGNPVVNGNRLAIGKSIYEFYMPEWAGIDPDKGTPMWYTQLSDGTRSTTGVYSNASKYYLGSAIPNLYGGITNTFNYKGFELSALLTYSLGGKIYDRDKLTILHSGSLAGRAWSTTILDRWTTENRNTDVPRLSTSTANSWTSQSSRFLVDASYARLKNIILTYNLPTSLLQKCGVKAARVYIQGDNLLTFFATQGLDPEQDINGTTYYRYPAMKSVSLGLNITL